MRVLEVEQRSPEWFAARAGLPTASNFAKIITATGSASKQANDYLYGLVAESMGAIDEGPSTRWMDRGTALEPEARDWYAFTQGVEVREVGFCINDAGTAGCSPDGLVGDRGGLEIKCLSPAKHVAAMANEKADNVYKVQIQGSLWVCDDREWWDLLYYSDVLPPFVRRKTRDASYIESLSGAITAFTYALADQRRKLGV